MHEWFIDYDAKVGKENKKDPSRDYWIKIQQNIKASIDFFILQVVHLLQASGERG